MGRASRRGRPSGTPRVQVCTSASPSKAARRSPRTGTPQMSALNRCSSSLPEASPTTWTTRFSRSASSAARRRRRAAEGGVVLMLHRYRGGRQGHRQVWALPGHEGGAHLANAIVLNANEKAEIQAPDRTVPILPMQEGLIERRSHDHCPRHRDPGSGSPTAGPPGAGSSSAELRALHRGLQQTDASVRVDQDRRGLLKEAKARRPRIPATRNATGSRPQTCSLHGQHLGWIAYERCLSRR